MNLFAICAITSIRATISREIVVRNSAGADVRGGSLGAVSPKGALASSSQRSSLSRREGVSTELMETEGESNGPSTAKFQLTFDRVVVIGRGTNTEFEKIEEAEMAVFGIAVVVA